MLRKEWQYYASKARKIAKHIKTGAEENRDSTRWSNFFRTDSDMYKFLVN